ncbi:uncharacterized protein LOC117329444 [Pecten maximus]|uniref:uncharacterized protein LOC117329444 n=1 Tax=Pecten maximus TaxID=6579 RepID=UPI0014580052|nr:uncharacterized protein LOC117329444 [Pecten maximus]XP_033743284.1 uncharacterized protein LOC117329444 [Pecten maximus]XP_033743285.1 uncharacterized protein LOC117329444 [Pecten maximus]
MTREVVSEIYHRYMNTLQFFCPNKDMLGGVGSGRYVCTGFSTNGKCLVYDITDEKKTVFFKTDVEDVYKCEQRQLKTSDIRTEMESLNLETPLTNMLTREVRIDVLLIRGDGAGDIANGLLQRGVLRHVDQLSIDFHAVNNVTSVSNYIKQILLLKTLYEEGFRIYHFERDPKYIFSDNPWRTGGYTLNMMRERRVDGPLGVPITVKNSTKRQLLNPLFSYLLTTEVLCKEILRVGDIDDGGWDVCVDDKYRPSSPCLVYSFGIKDDWSFDERIASRFGCEVHSFDPSIGLLDQRRSQLQWFHNLGLSGQNGTIKRKGVEWSMMNLKSIRTMLGHNNRQIDILKMDIERSEWISLPNILETGILKDVKQFYMEVHFVTNRWPVNIFADYLELLRQIHKMGFRLFWSHPNQVPENVGKSKFNDRIVSACYELYYVNINK